MRSPSTELEGDKPMKPMDQRQFARHLRQCQNTYGRDHFTEQGRLHDEARDRFMHSQGIRVLRFTGKQVETEIDWVLAQIDQSLGSPSQAPHPPTPSPRIRGEGE